MRALRAERSAAWHFLPAPCCRLTGDEQALVALLALARRQQGRDVDRAAARIAAADAAPRGAALAIERVACRLGAHQDDFAPATAALH